MLLPFRKSTRKIRRVQSSLDLTDIYLNILPTVMTDRLHLSNSVMGAAPGAGPDRVVVDVFYSRVEEVARILNLERNMSSWLSVSQILGHAISHEIGHILLNMELHSETGIMRGNWGTNDFQDAAYGVLVFTPQQAEVIRAEVIRRVRQHETGEVATLELPTLAR
jgi:hypothetical protein